MSLFKNLRQAWDNVPPNVQGMIWMALAGFLFAIFMAIVRYVGSNMNPVQSAFMRYGLGAVFLIPFFFRSGLHDFRVANYKLHLIRGLLHAFGVVLWFLAMARIPIAEVTALGFTNPVFVTIGAALFLGEKIRIRRWIAIIAGLVGAIVILRPGVAAIDIGAIAMLIASPIFAVSDIIAKVLTRKERGAAMVAIMSIIITIVLAGPAFYVWRPPTMEEWLLMGATACLATLGHLCFTQGFKVADLSVTQPVKFLQLMWSAAAGYFIFTEIPDLYTWIGAAIIIGSVSYIAHREAAARKRGEASIGTTDTGPTRTPS